MATKKTPYASIPRLKGTAADVKQLITIVETLIGTRGDGLEKAVTHRELAEGGVSISNGVGGGGSGGGGIGGGTPGGSVQTPTAPTGFTATGLYSANVLSWDRPTYLGHAYTEIYRSQENSFGTATVVGTEVGVLFADSAVEAAEPYFYWARHVNTNGTPGPINATDGTEAQTVIPAAAIIDAITGEILDSTLHESLQERLALIDAPDIGLIYQMAQEIEDRTLGIAAEAAARAAEIAAAVFDLNSAIDTEASSREALAAQMRGSYSGSDLNSVTSGLFYQERQARATAVDALALQISLLSAGVGGGFDPANTWYFDATSEGWSVAGATLSWAQGEITITSTGTDPQLTVGSLNILGTAYDVLKMRVKRVAGSGWQGDAYFSTAGGGGHSFSDSYKETLADPGEALDDWMVLEWNMSALSAGGTNWKDSTITGIRFDLGNSSADVFVIDWIAVGRNAPPASVASLLAEQLARAAADAAEVTARQTIAVKVFGNADPSAVPNLAAVSSGLLAEEKNARATADSNEVTARTTLQTKLIGAADPATATLAALSSGLLYEERQARSTAVASEVTARTTLQTKMIGAADPATATLAALTAGLLFEERQARSTADSSQVSTTNALSATLNDSTNGLAATRTRIATVESRISSTGAAGKSYETVVSELNAAKATIENPTTGVSALGAAVASINVSLSSQNGAITGVVSEMNQLQLMVGNDFAGIQQLQTVTLGSGGLTSQWTLKLDVNGLVSGYGLYNDGETTDFGISVDRFWIGSPTYAPRVANTAYSKGDIKTNSGNIYRVITAVGDKKTGAGSGPTGTGTAIVDGNVTWKWIRAVTTAAPLSLIVQDGQVLIPMAKIIDLQVDGAIAGMIGVDKIIGIDASFIMARIGTGSITNAYIGEIIQSYSYNPATGTGWRLDKSNGLITGNLLVLGPGGETLLDAGSRQLWAGRSTNLLSNTAFKNDTSGWATSVSGTNTSELSFGRNLSDSWTLTGEGTVYVQQIGTSACFGYWYATDYEPVIAGSKYEASFYSGAHRCSVDMQVIWYNSAKTAISTSTFAANIAANPGGPTLDTFQRIGGIATAPALATFARIRMRKQPTSSGGNSYLFGSRAMFAQAQPGQTELSPWSEGSPQGAFATQNQITPGNASTLIADASIGTLILAGQAVNFPVMAKRISGNYGDMVKFSSYPSATPSGVFVATIGTTILEAAGFVNIEPNAVPVAIDVSLVSVMNMNWVLAAALGGQTLNNQFMELKLYRVVGGVETVVDLFRVPIVGHNGDTLASYILPQTFTFEDLLPGPSVASYRLKLTNLPSISSIDQYRSLWLYRGVLRATAHKR